MARLCLIPLVVLCCCLLAGCALHPDAVVYGRSGRMFTAPEVNAALAQCASTDPPCFVDR